MHIDNLSLRPLVLSLSKGAMTLPVYLEALKNWTTFLEWQEPVVWLRVFDHDALHSGGSRQATLAGKQWMDTHSEAISRYVKGILFLVPGQDQPKFSKMNMEKAFGTKGLVCSDMETALAWIREHVEQPQHILTHAAQIKELIQASGFEVPQLV